jgi:predicted small lipoprotein YifL
MRGAIEMKSCLRNLLAIMALAGGLIGCGPRPIVEQPNNEQPAVNIDVKSEGAETRPDATDDEADVNVQVGGGEGIEVDVDRDKQ